MFMAERFLLVSNQPNSAWAVALRAALEPARQVDVVPPAGALAQSQQESYALIVVDAAELDDLPAMIKALHWQKLAVPVVVATASPTWQNAREAFLAGATDYLRKSLDAETLLTAFAEIQRKAAAG